MLAERLFIYFNFNYMKIIIKATNLELTPAINEYIEEKIGSLDKFLSKKFEKNSEIKIEVEIARTTKHHKSGAVYYAEANIHLPGKILRAEHFDWDIRVAIDRIRDILQQEIKKYKGTKMETLKKIAAKLRGKI